jgi:hypothetical protein
MVGAIFNTHILYGALSYSITFGFNIIFWVFYMVFDIHLNTKGMPQCWQGQGLGP